MMGMATPYAVAAFSLSASPSAQHSRTRTLNRPLLRHTEPIARLQRNILRALPFVHLWC
jgi:hypothetical protein